MKLLHVGELQKLIELSFVTDRAAQALADVRAAGRTGAVIRINHDVVRQLEIKIAQSVKLFFGQFLGVIRAQQIRPAGRRNEKRIARKHSPWRFRVICFGQDIRHMFRRVTGSMPRRHQHFAERKTIAVLHFLVLESVFGAAFVADKNFG